MEQSREIIKCTYAVIGGGIAGVSCVEQILEFEPDANILLVSSSSVVKEASNVTRLSKTLQDFIVVEKTLRSFKDVHQSVRVLQDDVISLNYSSNTLVTKKGEKVKYRKVCICTGASPKILFPDCEKILGIRDTESVQDLAGRISSAKSILLIGNGGIATEFVHEAQGVNIIWSIKDKSISAHYVDPGAAEFFIQSKICGKEESSDNTDSVGKNTLPKSVCENNKSILADDCDMTEEPCKRMKYTLSSVNVEDMDMNSTVDKKLGSALGPDWHAGLRLCGEGPSKKVTIEYETECKRILTYEEYKLTSLNAVAEKTELNEHWPIYAELSNGKCYGCDFVISATGVVPNCEWFEGVSEPEKGIYVDTNLRTSLPNVYAAGDVCHPQWSWSKHWFQMRLWTQARQMGLFAGKSMVHSVANEDRKENDPEVSEEELELDFCFEMFSHVTRFFGFKVVLLGLYNGQGLDKEGQHLLIRCTKNLEYIKIVLVNWRMQGAILIGETGLEETFENLILNQIDLSSYGEDLLNPDIDIEDYFD